MENSPRIDDQEYLLHEQYKDSSSFQRRLQGLQQMGLDFAEHDDAGTGKPFSFILEYGLFIARKQASIEK